MNNHQNEIDRVMAQIAFEKQKDRKHSLRIEIAKATDRTVKNKLQNMLDDIEKKERKNMVFGIILAIFFILVFLYVIGTRNATQEVDNVLAISSSTNTSEKPEQFVENTTTESIVPVVKEKNLSEAEVKQWVSAVWEKRYQNIPSYLNYKLDVKINDKDNLVYITVIPNRNSQGLLGRLRINANGDLEEETGYGWTFTSGKFMDTSDVIVLEQPGTEESFTPPTSSEESTIPTSREEPKYFEESEEALEAASDRVDSSARSKENSKKAELSSEEFAELYSEWSSINLPIMPFSEFIETYGTMDESDNYDNSIMVLTYNDKDSDVISITESRPHRMSEYFYTYDNDENKAYRNATNASRGKEFLPDLTNFINSKMN